VEFLKAIWNWLGDSKEQIVSISAVIGVFIAVSGLRTWRKELKGKSEYQKAKDVLKAVYRVRNGFMIVRSPGIYAYEYPKEMLNDSGYLKSECEYEGTLHVYQTRMKFLEDAFRDLEDQTLEAQVEWGKEFQNVIIPLRKCRGELVIAIQDFLESKKVGRMHESTSEERKDRRSKLYYVGENFELDSFTPEINTAIESFEKKLRPHINRSSFIFNFWKFKRR
jgi:hypothetical protein